MWWRRAYGYGLYIKSRKTVEYVELDIRERGKEMTKTKKKKLSIEYTVLVLRATKFIHKVKRDRNFYNKKGRRMIERVDSLSLDRFFIYVSFNYSTVLYCRLKLIQYTITMYMRTDFVARSEEVILK